MTPSPVTRAVLWVLRLYRTGVSPLRPASCRYVPTCSAYAVEAIETYGIVRGTLLALRRVGRCHPFHRGGHDPVPARVSSEGGPASSRSSRPARA